MDLAEGHINALDALLASHSPAGKSIFSSLDVAKGGRFRAFNLGRGKGLSVLDMISAMKGATGFDYNYEIVGRRYVHLSPSRPEWSRRSDRTATATCPTSLPIRLLRRKSWALWRSGTWTRCAGICGASRLPMRTGTRWPSRGAIDDQGSARVGRGSWTEIDCCAVSCYAFALDCTVRSVSARSRHHDRHEPELLDEDT